MKITRRLSMNIQDPNTQSSRRSLPKAATFGATLLMAMLLSFAWMATSTQPAYAQLFCNADVGGDEDENQGQSDLTRFCIDEANAPATISVGWNWDDSTFNGNSDGYACAIFDGDGDGNANYMVCVRVGSQSNGASATMEAFSVVQCTQDNFPDKCGGGQVINPAQTTCTAGVVAGSDPFDGSSDTVAACTINLADFGNIDPIMTNVCSFPSGEGSDPKDCIAYVTGGFITVQKVATPNQSTPFTFSVKLGNTAVQTPTILGSGFSQRYSVPNGFYTVSEVIPTDWVLTDAACVGGTSNGTFSGNAVSGIQVFTGDDVVCTFNDQKKGTITVVKNTIGGNGTFAFASPQLNNFNITTVANTGSQSFTGLISGTYSINELLASTPGWTLNNIACTTGSNSSVTIGAAGGFDAGDTSATVNLFAGDSVTCTYTNQRQAGRIIIEKQTIPDGASQTFTFTRSFGGDIALADGQTSNSGDLAEGQYSVSEIVPVGWSQSAATCSDGSAPSAIGLSAGETVTCTFTNAVAAIAVSKSANQLHVAPGTLVTYFYTVTNPGQVPLTVTSINDNKCSPVTAVLSGSNNAGDSNLNTLLDIGESWQFTCAATLIADTTNIVTVVGTPSAGPAVSASANATVDVFPTIVVTKTASPTSIPETGGTVTFIYEVGNTSAEPVVISSLSDDIFGPLAGDADCQLGTQLAPGASCSFSVPQTLAGDAPNTHTNLFTAEAEDDENNTATDSDNAVVTFTDVRPTITVTKTASPTSVPETGSAVTFDYEVSNSGLETVTISALSDDKFGILAGDADCQIGTVLEPGESCTFSINQTLAGDAPNTHVNIFTAAAKDDENNTATDNDNAIVTFTDVLPTISATKSANPTSVAETGGAVTFSYEVRNSGQETVTIATLSDNIFGTLAGDADCKVGTVLAPGASCSFDLVKTISGDAPNDHVNVFTVTAKDDENNTATANDDASVTFTDVKPIVSLNKSVTPTSLPEPGGLFTFTLSIQNTSLETATITSLTDDYSLNAACLALVNEVLSPNEIATCQYTVTLTNPGVYTNTANVTVADDEGNQANDSDDAEATITNVGSSIKVTKNANPTTVAEPGGTVAYNIVVENTSPVDGVTINSILDDKFFNISGSCTPDLPATLAPGAKIICNFTKLITGNAGETHTNIVTATGVDDDGEPVSDNDDAVVRFTDVASSIEVTKIANPTTVNEPGGNVNYTVTVKNTSPADVITITSVLDDKFGNVGGSCQPPLPATLQPNASLVCTFTRAITGNAGDTHTNIVTVAGTDDDGTPVGGSDTATVMFNNVNSSLEVIKTASPSSIDEPGTNVTYTVVVRNTSSVDAVTVNTVVDDKFGDVSSSCSPSLPRTLAVGASLTCSFTRFIAGNTGDTHTNLATASGIDDDGQPVSADDSAIVSIGGLPSSVEVVKIANPTSVNEPGGTVNYTVYITNTSVADVVTINTLTDDKFGTVTSCSPQLPAALNPGAGMVCTFSAFVSGQPGDTHTNVVTAATVDDDGNEMDYSDDATVTFNDITSSLEVVKTANPVVVPEPGGLVTFTVSVKNSSAVDAVTINQVVDDRFGNVSSSCQPALPRTLQPGQGLLCTFARTVSGQAGATHTNIATASGTDDDGNPVSGNDNAVVTISNVGSSIQVSKIANPSSISEPGGAINYQVTVENTSPVDSVTISTVLDDKFGNIGNSCQPALPATIAPGSTLVCSFTRTITGNAGDTHTNLVTVTGFDDDQEPVGGEDSAIVTITDLASSIEVSKKATPTIVTEAGSNVTYAVTIRNTSTADTVTINSVNDDKFGNVSSSCQPALPATISPNGTITCTFIRFISGQAGDSHINVVSVTGVDDDGNPVSDSADATVTISDLASSIVVTKTANPLTVSEPGGNVTFTVQVRNTSATDAVTINTVNDDKFGNVGANCVPALPVTLQPNGTLTCSFTRLISGNAGDTHTNVITVTGIDDDEQPVTGQDDATVTITDVASAIRVTKSANPLKIDAPGATVTYTVKVDNISPVDSVTINTVSDNKFGDVSNGCTPALPVTLAPGQSLLCTFTGFVSGIGNSTHVNIATVSGTDDDGQPVSGSDDASVDINEVVESPPSDLQVDKSTSITSTQPSGVIVYTIVYRNDGEGQAVNAVVVETVPEHTTFDATKSSTGWQCALDSVSNRTKCRFVVGNLNSGAQGTLLFAVTVDKNIPEEVKNIINLVTIRSDDVPDDPADSDVVMTPVFFPTALEEGEEPPTPSGRKLFLPLVSR